ncbi:MAG: hypothetical protein LBC98_07415 [Prevotellaceae bacterium]|jgi:hypothetical protein|nr:hypothetical protein [Prevotellaceae bacterium]
MFPEVHHRYSSSFTRYMRHSDLIPLLEAFSDDFELNVVGRSLENRAICCIKAGCGSIKVLAWSQMHGDESTATGALLDILNFLRASDVDFRKERSKILNGLTLYFVPMLNPDGAERQIRNNAMDVDLNRDALDQATPESAILQSLFDRIAPDYALNLHDQESYYAASGHNPATISLLAPPDSPAPSQCGNRARAIKSVCFINRFLQNYIPGGVGKWSDDYEARAFGEHFQKAGSATVLIESGGYFNDPERNVARKLNFSGILQLFLAIVSGELNSIDASEYQTIPLNRKGVLFDIILRKARIMSEGREIVCDIGLRKTEKFAEGRRLETAYTIESTGDLSNFAGYEEYLLH